MTLPQLRVDLLESQKTPKSFLIMGCGPSAIPEDLSDAVIDISQVMVTVVVIVLFEKCQNYNYILIYSNKSQKIKMKITRIEILKIIPTKTEVYHHKPKSRTGWDILNCCK